MRTLRPLLACLAVSAALPLVLAAGCAKGERPAPAAPGPVATPAGPETVVIDQDLGGNLTFRDTAGNVVAVADLKLPGPLPTEGTRFNGWWYVRSAKAGAPAGEKEGGRFAGRVDGRGLHLDLNPELTDAGVSLNGSPQDAQDGSWGGKWYKRNIAGGEAGGTFVLTAPRGQGE